MAELLSWTGYPEKAAPAYRSRLASVIDKFVVGLLRTFALFFQFAFLSVTFADL